MDRRLRILLVSLIACAFTLPMAASGAVFAPRAIDRYSSASMWPALTQQKYFTNLASMAPTNDGLYLWASEQNSHQIIRIRLSDGVVVQRVGRHGSGNAEFDKPAGIAIRPTGDPAAGDVLVCDSGNDRVQVFDSTGNFKRTFGYLGAGSGQLDEPVDVAVDSNGYAWVAEVGNKRFQWFNQDYIYGNKFAATNTPRCLTVHNGAVYIGETDLNVAAVHFYNAANGVPLGSIGSYGAADNQFYWPSEVAFDADGNLLVADSSRSNVRKFNTSGTYLATVAFTATGSNFWEMDSTYIPRAFAMVGTTCYVSDSVGIKMYNWQTATALNGAGWTAGSQTDGWFYKPNAIACGGSGTAAYVWVADSELNKIQKFSVDSSGKLTYAGVKITGSYAAVAHDLVTDADGNLYVAALSLDKVYKFDSSGVYQTEWASNDPWGIDYYGGKIYVVDMAGKMVRIYSAPNVPASPAMVGGVVGPPALVPELSAPKDVAVTGAAVFVLDTAVPYVKKFKPNGTESPLNDYLGSWGNSTSEFFNGPDAISTDAYGNVYLVDSETGRIAKYNGNGVYLGEVGSSGSGTGEVSYPKDVAISDELDTFVVEQGAMRVQTFRPNRATKSRIVPGSAPAYAKPASFGLYAGDADGMSIDQNHGMKFRYGYSAKGPWSAWISTWGNGTGYTTTWNLTRRTYFQAYTMKTTTSPYLASYSPVISIAPKVVLSNAVAPATMSHLSSYSVYATLKPRHTAGTYPVRIYKYRYVNGVWKSYGYVNAKAANYSTYTKCIASVKLPYAGTWRLRTYAPADSLHAATWSAGYDTVIVK